MIGYYLNHLCIRSWGIMNSHVLRNLLVAGLVGFGALRVCPWLWFGLEIGTVEVMLYNQGVSW